MVRVIRCTVVLLLTLLLTAAGCDEDPPRLGGSQQTGSPSASDSNTPTGTTPTPSDSPSTSATPTARMSGVARRTGITITKDGTPIDALGLRAVGWTVLAEQGEAHWADPSLGSMVVSWDVPDSRAVSGFDISVWGRVTGANLAMSPNLSTTVFTGVSVQTSAHSRDGKTAEAPIRHMRVGVPEQLVGNTATVSVNLSWPVPVLVTYNYVYE
ncbi:MAG TPA: hypothetical protein VLI04_15885 [Nocardioidaceae bacterium]|nr:hypothetical protein [Nocardioidaceae bacterium]